MKTKGVLERVEQDFQDYVSQIPSSNKKTKPLYLESLNRLAYLFYIQEEAQLSQQLAGLLSQISFDGNFNEWTFVERSIALLAFLQKEDERQVKKLKQIILDRLEAGNRVNQNVHQRFLAGATLEMRLTEIETATSPQAAMEYRFAYLGDLLKLYLFKDQSAVPSSQLLDHIEAETEAIRNYLEENQVQDLFPYKTR